MKFYVKNVHFACFAFELQFTVLVTLRVGAKPPKSTVTGIIPQSQKWRPFPRSSMAPVLMEHHYHELWFNERVNHQYRTPVNVWATTIYITEDNHLYHSIDRR